MGDDAIERQALAWRDRLAEDRSAATREAFLAWLGADPRHASVFDQQVKLETAMHESRFRGVMPDRQARPVLSRAGTWWAAGAVAAAVAAAVLAPSLRGSPPLAHTETAFTEAHALRLGDGSLVVLGRGAVLAPVSPKETRAVRLLSGTARFIIAPDVRHPFIVTAGQATITELGTVFDVTVGGPRVQVALLEGRVEVATAGRRSAPAVLSRPGEATVAGDGQVRRVAPVSPSAIEWLDVDGMALRDVLSVATRGNGDPIELGDAATGARRVTGRFYLRDRQALARKLAAALDLRVVDAGGRLILMPR